MRWLLDLFRGYPEAFSRRAETVIVFGPDREECAAEVADALGKRAAVVSVDGAAGVAELLAPHMAGSVRRCQLVFAHFIPVKGAGLATQDKARDWMVRWDSSLWFPKDDPYDHRVEVGRVAGTNRVFVRVIWPVSADPESIIEAAKRAETRERSFAADWLK